jgi:hypothetical protein
MQHLQITNAGKTLIKKSGMQDYECTNIGLLISAGIHEWNIKTHNANIDTFVGVCRQKQLHKK